MARRQKPNRREPMGEKVVIEISPSSAKKDTRFKNPTCKQEKNEKEAEDGSPLRPIFCPKKNVDVKRIEEMEDCFILDFNPFDSIDIAKLSVTTDGDDVDLSVVAEKGPRLSAFKASLSAISFDTTPHERHCDQCYCYVCDLAAPCECWMTHCHASEHAEDWKCQRNLRRILNVRPRKL